MEENASSQQALEHFLITQLIDNGMDTIANKINKYYAKMQHAAMTKRQVSLKTKKKWAKRLRRHLLLACQVLQKQHEELSSCIQTIKKDIKEGVFDQSSSTDQLQQELKQTKQQPEEQPPAVGSYVAARVARSHELWILARVINYDNIVKTYEVEDVDYGEDDGDEKSSSSKPRRHVLPPEQIIQLPAETMSLNSWIKYKVNDRVLAVYPETTSFYRAVVQLPNPKVRRNPSQKEYF
jgi:SAGA-associated factor 29